MRLTLELATPAAAALARRAVQHRRPVALEALHILERALGVAGRPCSPACCCCCDACACPCSTADHDDAEARQ